LRVLKDKRRGPTWNMKSSIPGRLACVDLPAFPLQLLLRRHPDWAGHPAAVVAQDKPQGLVLWVNEKAREQGVLPGLRYAAAFSLASTLRAGEVSPAESEKALGDLTARLMRFTPEVERRRRSPASSG
jgi:protein ImuB